MVGAFESDSVIVVRSRPVIDIETWFGKKPESIRPDLPGCEGDVYSPEVCFVIESCFLIKNFPTNIETTHIRSVKLFNLLTIFFILNQSQQKSIKLIDELDL